MADLSDFRKVYDKGFLVENDLPNSPFDLFENWFKAAAESGTYEANAMTLATATATGHPRARVVLLKSYDENGFVFFTNYESAKGRALAENPQVCLAFFWEEQERQVIIEGVAEKTSREVTHAYFQSRPRESQLGAWASPQSSEATREELIQKLEQLNEKYPDEIPTPNHWGGYLVKPTKIEFWQGRPSRLHDRIVFENENGSWKRYRVAP
ncbi:pyridoxamine 5'-phosphate oxidase [Flavobacterium sp.]|uniref:pyridoxamine 5'-phosphate oxidase n=1 Tax=Flavobacterium sp. TaxID=239 RepID=UPI003446B1EF